MRMYGAEKLQSFVTEVEGDAGRAGCFTERQPRRGLAGDGERPETSASKDPCERTPIANERAQVNSLHAQKHPRDAVRRSRGPFTHLCRAERECKSVKMALSPAQTTVLKLPVLARAFLRTELAQTHSTTEVAKFQPEAFWSWIVPTGTLDRGAYLGGRCVALTWPSEIDVRPDCWPSDHIPAPWPDVWFECSSSSTHCSKVRGSISVGTGFHKPLLGRPSGDAGGAIRHSQGASGRSVARWRGLGSTRTT